MLKGSCGLLGGGYGFKRIRVFANFKWSTLFDVFFKRSRLLFLLQALAWHCFCHLKFSLVFWVQPLFYSINYRTFWEHSSNRTRSCDGVFVTSTRLNYDYIDFARACCQIEPVRRGWSDLASVSLTSIMVLNL